MDTPPPGSWFDDHSDDPGDPCTPFSWNTSTDSAPLARPADEPGETVEAMHRRWLQHGLPVADRPRNHPRRCTPEIADLMAGVELDEFFLEYQPIVALASGRIEGFEALLRWRHPRRGVLHPRQFIADAEASGALALLTPTIVDEACRACAGWTGAGQPIAVSINLCGAQLRDPDLVPEVAAAIRATAIAPERVWFEITENTGARHALMHRETLHDLRRLGVRLALDDFGTGCASIGCLRGLPVDAVKIDRSLVAQAGASRSGARVLAASTEIARALGITAVAEGIERSEHFDRARAVGCELGQGFYFARAVDKGDADRMAVAGALPGPPGRFPQKGYGPDAARVAKMRQAATQLSHAARC